MFDHLKGALPGGYYMQMIGRSDRFQYQMIPFILIWVGFVVVVVSFLFITFVVPEPRKPTPLEKTYRTLDEDGNVTEPEPLPCWVDRSLEKYAEARKERKPFNIEESIEPAEILITVVVPAYNEEKRLIGMLEETVNYLEDNYGTLSSQATIKTGKEAEVDGNGSVVRRRNPAKIENGPQQKGWEILLIDDGSSDKTLEVAENFSRTHLLPRLPRRMSGPWSHRAEKAVNIPPGSIRMVSLESNRGKGGAVTHGMRHARGQYIIFADADGASDFKDVHKVISACQKIEDAKGRAVAVGSRAHLVGSDAVVKRSKLRNFLMHSFHLLLRFMTPPKTAKIKDTQCGFKMFSRPSLPYIIPHMHTEGWIFDVEMLMLAEFAGIPVVEVPIGWKEVHGSKLNVLKDSIGMAWGLAVLRFCWGTGIYRR